MKKIGLFIEFKDGGIKPATFGMITAARGEDHELFALVVNEDAASCRDALGEYGVRPERPNPFSPPPPSAGIAGSRRRFFLPVLRISL